MAGGIIGGGTGGGELAMSTDDDVFSAGRSLLGGTKLVGYCGSPVEGFTAV